MIAATAIAFAIVPPLVSAQGTQPETYRVLIDGTLAGTASSASNLPTDTVVMRQDSNPAISRRQVASAEQGKLILTSADPALIAAINAWIKADNSGAKNTVQRKAVEIDRSSGTGGMRRYQLSDAWPASIQAANGSSMITIVYQRLAIIP